MPADRPMLFDTRLIARRRDRAMALGFAGGADFLWRRAAEGIAERLLDTGRPFADVALVGSGAGAVAAALPPVCGARRLVQVEPSPAMARAAAAAHPASRVIRDGAETLPLEPGAADLALSVLTMHWLNDPVGHLVQLRHALRPDGLMIAALLGGGTLAELRAAFATAEAEVLGGITPRVAPMGEIRDLGGLIQRAGLAMPVADAERLTVEYDSPLHLMRDLRAMGETSMMLGRPRGGLRRELLARVCALYAQHHGAPSGRVRASFELVFLTGWAPAPDQPQPRRPGSARVRLADALGTVERPAGDKAGGRNT